jgi:type IV pilus assembly protein PilA
MFKKLGSKLKEQKGFTLIELLAVIVILGIIAAIAIPAIGNVITKSENKSKVQDALLIINAAKLYVADQRPTVATTLTLDADAASASADDAIVSLDPYLDRVADKDFEVIVTPGTAVDGVVKYSYTIGDHEAVSVVNGTPATKVGPVTEKKLSEYQQ